MKDKVRDDYERPIISLRISITNRCNVDCIYCHHDGMLESSSEMTPDEIYEICRIAKKLGFRDLTILETLEREMEIRPQGTRPKTRMVGHSGYLVFARKL